MAPTPGTTRLELAEGRDGVLHIPRSYATGTPAPLLVALHGAGGAGGSWASYPERAERRGMILLAPDSRSHTWDVLEGGFGPDVRFLDAALRHTFARCRVDPSRIALAGFSDGASYALSLGLANGDLFSRLIAFAPGLVETPATEGRPGVFVAHGADDEVLPVRYSRDLIVPRLRAGGYDVTYVEFDGGHEVPSEISEEALDWFLRS